MAEANGVVDEGFMRRYRQLLDAEDTAFDELEHAYEDGDRAHFGAAVRSLTPPGLGWDTPERTVSAALGSCRPRR